MDIHYMKFKYGDIIRLKECAKPQLTLDAETFLGLVDDEKADVKTYWSLPKDAFDIDDMGFVYLKSEYSSKLVWGVDAVVEEDGICRLNINVAYDPEGDVNCGAFCSWVDCDEVEGNSDSLIEYINKL